jgi:hypothetical protein
MIEKPVHQLYSHLINSGSLSEFQMYIMIILGIKLFRRTDELLLLSVEHFNKKYQIFNDDKIKPFLDQGKSRCGNCQPNVVQR